MACRFCGIKFPSIGAIGISQEKDILLYEKSPESGAAWLAFSPVRCGVGVDVHYQVLHLT